VTVYNDDGQEFALKLFLPDNDDDDDEETKQPTEIGALREISCLRLFRGDNKHENIVELQDVQTEWNEDGDEGGGAGTSGCLGMALPLGKSGSLADAIRNGTFQGYPKTAKVAIAHGLLSAVAFLHDNGILHRDIKSDNILLSPSMEPILIDFSLAKPIDGTIWGHPELHAEQLEAIGHTGEVGTVVYTAPEITKQEEYGKPADLFSVGVVLLELLQNQSFTAEKASHVAAEIEKALLQLPEDAPFPNLIRSLLKENPAERVTARQALQHPVFTKFGFAPPSSPRIVNVGDALPYDNAGNDDEEEENEAPAVPRKNAASIKNRKNKKRQQRLQRIDKYLNELESDHPWTRAAALEYSQQMEQVDEDVDNPAESQALADCCVLAHRFFELELPDLDELNERDSGVFADWTLEQYVDNEASIFMLLDFCLYPRSLTAAVDE